ncbi:hypothetical protein DV736_g2170, partial [Chaetothyriales sp. CBS 134916]
MSLSIRSSSSHQDDAGAGASTGTVDVTIRFSASLPDLPLSISLATHPYANTCTLKQLIRRSLPAECANRRIRLIYAGKALLDNDPLTSSLKRRGPAAAAASTPSSNSTPSRAATPTAAIAGDNDKGGSGGGKGKTPIRDPVASASQHLQQQLLLPRIYVHCSIGDLTLPPAELEREARVASVGGRDTAHHSPARHAGPRLNASSPLASSYKDNGTDPLSPPPPPSPPAPPPARGFDRLLASGFSPPEVASLRLQFLSIQSHTHTPDTMPSPTTLRSMEDAWLDGSDSLAAASSAAITMTGATTTADGGAGAATGTGYEATEQSALDDMLFGTAMGFFWPVGCLLWGVREEGVWSTRRKMAVVVGVCLNLVIGLVKFGA